MPQCISLITTENPENTETFTELGAVLLSAFYSVELRGLRG